MGLYKANELLQRNNKMKPQKKNQQNEKETYRMGETIRKPYTL